MQSNRLFMIYAVLVIVLAIPFLVLGQKNLKKLSIFNPDMKPSAGDWGSPAVRVGDIPPKPWSETSIQAAIKQKPLEAKVVTRSGELIDLSCYLQLGKHGKDHEACAKGCLLNGQPFGLLEDTGQVYLLLPEEHDARRDGKLAFRDALIDHVAQIVEISGAMTNVKGVKTIFVQGFVKKEDVTPTP